MEQAKGNETKEGVKEENKNEKGTYDNQTLQKLFSSSEVKMYHSELSL